MSNEKKLRLNQVAREFKVGQATIIDFLDKKGVKLDNSPSTIIPGGGYELLEKEFGSNKGTSVNIRERINLKQDSVSLKDKKDGGLPTPEGESVQEQKKTVAANSNTERVNQPKILGKIDLDSLKKPASKQQPKPQQPSKVEAMKDVAKKVEVKPEVVSVPKPEVVVKPQEVKKTEPAVKAVATEVKPKSDETKIKVEALQNVATQDDAPKINIMTPTKEDIQNKTYDERLADNKEDLFRPNSEANKLSGPKVLGKIDVQSFAKKSNDSSKREKRKRITKEKVDVTKPQQNGGNATGGQRAHGQHGANGGNQNRSHNNANRPNGGAGGNNQNRPNNGGGAGGNNQNRPNNNAANKKKGAFNRGAKPVVRQEVSDEDVQKQIKDTLARLTSKGNKGKSAKYRKDKRDAVNARMHEEIEKAEQEKSVIQVTEFVTVSELATMMEVGVTEVITACMNLGLMVSINQRLDAEALVVVAEEFGYKVEFVSVEIQESIEEDSDEDEDLIPRPPIVTVMGHVDHGKTSLLDNIRKTNVISGEAGGITQHIGAYSVELDGKKITFLDTPGHEAFTAMRARGAKVTDVAIIIVAADDSVMPQTVEAINHASAAGVPMVFAINKIDKPGANPDQIREQLAQMNYLLEDWGGKYQSQEVSAKMGINLDKLLEKVLLEAELLELKANPDKKASGVIIESTLDKGRGYVSTILVQNGTLRVGDVMLSGVNTGRVKAMFDENGKKVSVAPPSTPVQVLGLNGAPQAGDTFNIMEDDRSAREIANKREQLQRMQGLRTQKHVTLDEIGRRIAIGNFKELNIIVKGDVDGSIEAMTGSLLKLSKDEVQVNVIHKAVGQISESDVLLAAASNAVIVGFQVRPSASARRLAEKEEIEIRLYSIIYDAINDIKDAIEGMLAPVMKEEIVCSVEVLETFKISKVGTIAGCIVREGKITRNTSIRIIRDGIVAYTGKLGSLKRFKDDAKEVTNNMECGLNIDNFNDIKVGDFIEGYEVVEVKRK